MNTGVDNTNPAMIGGWDTQHMAAVVVFSAILFLVLIRKGFRGLNVGGLSVNVK